MKTNKLNYIILGTALLILGACGSEADRNSGLRHQAASSCVASGHSSDFKVECKKDIKSIIFAGILFMGESVELNHHMINGRKRDISMTRYGKTIIGSDKTGDDVLLLIQHSDGSESKIQIKP